MSSRSASIYLAVAEIPARFTTGIEIGDCHHPQATHECRPNRRQTLPPLVHRASRTGLPRRDLRVCEQRHTMRQCIGGSCQIWRSRRKRELSLVSQW
jgi:hypothetical protein